MKLGNQCFKRKKIHETPGTEVSIDSNLNFPTWFLVSGPAIDYDI